MRFCTSASGATPDPPVRAELRGCEIVPHSMGCGLTWCRTHLRLGSECKPTTAAKDPLHDEDCDVLDSRCPHAALVDVDRLASVSEVAQRGPSWLLDQIKDGPMWLTRNSRVVAVIHSVGRDYAE